MNKSNNSIIYLHTRGGAIMEKPQVERENFHYNFLKHIIIRLDFQGVLESEMEPILLKIKPYIKSQKFDRYEERFSNQININLANLNVSQEIIQSNRPQTQKIYSFINENKGYSLDISNRFICLNINSVKYVPFEEYIDYVSYIAKIYEDSIDFFTVKRFGIRKSNICFVDDKEKINTYFKENRFGFFNDFSDVNTLISKRNDLFVTEKYKINLNCNLEQGKEDDKIIYKVLLDIDAFLDNTKAIEDLIFDKSELQNMNAILFNIYANSLTDVFKEALMSEDDFPIEGIKGIESNE